MLVLTVLMVLAVPSFRSAGLNAQQRAALEQLQSAMRLAQSVADRDRRVVTLCTSGDGVQCSGSGQWEGGWIVRSVNPQNPNEIVVRAAVEAFSDVISIRSMGFNNAASIDFHYVGAATPTLNAGTFFVCDDRGAESAQGLVLMSNGQFYVATDEDLDGRVNTHDGGNVAC